MFKKRSAKVQPRKREQSDEAEEEIEGRKETQAVEDEKIDLQELLALRKLQRAHKGIDVNKLNQGDSKKKKRPKSDDADIPEPSTSYGLQPKKVETDQDDEENADDEEAKARKLVRSNNFTQQTNALDVDKHMMAYIEENLKKRRGESGNEPKADAPYDPHEELFRIEERYRIKKKVVEEEEGNVTNSLAMLTAIPEVDLGMDVRLKNIEETEKAKRMVADERRARLQQQSASHEPDLASTRFFKPHQALSTDTEALRLARLEAQGLPAEPAAKRQWNDRREMATDDQVMERFKKRMRK